MSAPTTTPARQDFGADWLRRSPRHEEQLRALWEMTPTQRITAMRSGRLTMTQCFAWSSRRPHEVPLLNGEFEFIAARTPEVAES
jgi:hypothetical protein